MSSGVQVSDDCVQEFNKLKLKHAYSYIIFKIEDEKQIIVEKKGDKGMTFQDFASALLDTDGPRYAMYDAYVTKAGITANDKLALISWNPDTGKIKDKMLYASSFKAFKSKLIGYACEIQCNDEDDLTVENITSKLK